MEYAINELNRVIDYNSSQGVSFPSRFNNPKNPGTLGTHSWIEQQSMIIILRNKRVIDKIKTETAVMKRVLWTDGESQEKW